MKKKANKKRDARPEHSAPAEHFYDRREATQYDKNVRMAQIQTNLAQRALHLLKFPSGKTGLILEVGCGTGFGGRVLEKSGHAWIGADISMDMLAAGRRPGLGSDHICHDIGVFLPFRRGMFDGAISISAVQWLCVATKEGHQPELRLRAFMRGLHRCLRPGSSAVLQFYPEDPSQMEMIREAALECHFRGNLITDYPISEAAKKFFLVLTTSKQGPPARKLKKNKNPPAPSSKRKPEGMQSEQPKKRMKRGK